MSVRAYRVEKIDTATPNSFNLWHDTELVDYLDEECGFFENLGDGGGLTEVPITVLRSAIKELNLDPDTIKCLEQDIEAGEKDNGFVTYYCF